MALERSSDVSAQFMCLKCHIVKFTEEVNLADTLVVNFSLQGLFSVLRKDGSTSILRLKHGNVSNLTLGTVACKRLFWDSQPPPSPDSALFFAQDSEGALMEFAVLEDSVSLQRQLPLAPLRKAIEDFSHWGVTTIQLAGYEKGYLLFVVNGDTLCVTELLKDVCLPCSWIPLPSQGTDTQHTDMSSLFQVTGDFMGVLHQHAQLLFIYRLCGGQLVCQISLKPAWFCSLTGEGETPTPPPCWSLSPSLTTLVWAGSQGDVCCLDLPQYLRSNSSALHLPEQGQGSHTRIGITQTVRTCRRGRLPWRQSLMKVHQQQIGEATGVVWPLQELTRSVCERNLAEVRACGFRGSDKETEDYLKMIKLPAGHLVEVGYAVHDLCCSPSSVTMMLTSPGNPSNTVICMVDLTSQHVYLHSIPSDHVPVVMPTANLPIMLLLPGSLLMLAPRPELYHQDVVTQLMVHSGAQMTDSVCQLNKWSHSTVPLQALELGLRQHQLDTVSFFLTTQQNLFTSHFSITDSNSHQGPTWSDQVHLHALNDLCPALDLFLRVIRGEHTDISPPEELRVRLMTLILDFLQALLKDGTVRLSQLGDGEEREMNDLHHALQEVLQVVMGYVAQLRAAILAGEVKQKAIVRGVGRHGVGSWGSRGSACESVDSVSLDSGDVPLPALTVCTQEEIETACTHNDLPTLQSRLLAQDQVGHAQWGQVVKVGLQRALSCIQSHDLTAAQSIIASMGLDVGRTVWSLSQFTTNRSLQQYIIQQLTASATLSPCNMQLVDFVNKLYKLYPATSVSQSLKDSQISKQWSAQNPLASHVRSVQTSTKCQASDISLSSTTTTTTPAMHGPLCVTALHWLSQLDDNSKQALLLDGAVLHNKATEDSQFNPRMLWQYWLSRNHAKRALHALEAAMAKERGMLGSLLENYFQDLHLASTSVQHEIKTRLLRKRVYRWEMVESLNTSAEEKTYLLTGLLHTPHPLHGYAHSTLCQFHRHFAEYCARYNLVLPLWIYCTVHGVDVESLLDVPCAKDVRWWKPFICLHSAISRPDQCGRMFAGSLSMAGGQYRREDSPHDDWNLTRLLTQGQVTAAAATLAYLPDTHSIAQGGEGEGCYSVEVGVLRSGLERFPKLLSALLPPDADTSRYDVNVYELLMDNAPLDTRKLFGWQVTNTGASEDAMKVLPYFSRTDLVSGFAHTATLHFTYYLRHGRPTYAFLAFMHAELQHKTSTLSPKRVRAACGVALWLCVKNFHSSHVTSACVTFVEMLGRDSVVLRMYVQAGEIILCHKMRQLTGPIDKRKEFMKISEQDVVVLLQSCVGKRRGNGQRLLAVLEDAIVDQVAREGLSGTSVEAALKWNVAIIMCQHLRLPLTTRYLELCAHDDRWLPFLWFSQLHQYPKTQLQQLAHQFSSRQLRDHLHYIITNASSSTVTPDTPQPEGGGGGSADGSRSVRSSLYSRMRLNTARVQEEGSSEEEEEERRRTESSEQHRVITPQSDDHDIDVKAESTASDVFRVLFSALGNSEPCKSLLMHAVVLRNPLFAELAACCNAPLVSCMCAWLVAMLSSSQHAVFVEHHGKRAWHWSEKHLEKLIDVYLECHAENTLTAAFFIFQPTSPLLCFLQFIKECVSWRNYEGCKRPLDNFKDAMASISGSPSKGDSDQVKGQGARGDASCDVGMQVIGDRNWLERVCYTVVRYELLHCPSVYDALHMLHLLAEENIALVFSFDVLDFGHLHKMLSILHKHGVSDVHLPHLFSPAQHQTYLQHCQRAMQSLMAQRVYEDAYTFGHYAGLDLTEAVFTQLVNEKQQLQTLGVWSSEVIRRRYWKQAASKCGRFHLPPPRVADFFQKEAEGQDSLLEKSALYKMSQTHLQAEYDRQTEDGQGAEHQGARHHGVGQQKAGQWLALRDQIFTNMWRCNIQHRVAMKHTRRGERERDDMFSDMEDMDTMPKMSSSRQEILHTPGTPTPQVDPANELNSEEAMELEVVMGDLLAEGHVWECCDLARLLGGQSRDLTIVLTCIGLSTGEVTVATMDAASRLLLTTTERRPSLTSLTSFVHTASSVSLASAAPDWGFLPSAQEEIIFTMEQLLSRCHTSRPCCLRIISVYKIACLIGRGYKEIVLAEEFSVLRELLKTDFPHRYLLAADFLSTSTLSDAEVASFLVDEIVKSLRIYLGGKDIFDGSSASRGTKDLMFRPTEGGEVFSQLVSLCADPALLGDKLLQALATMADDASTPPSHAVLSMETELLIMAHECHTAACNMEGISNVLRAARVCAQCLSSASQYHLMMRLLTGIGRYSEMTYIFDFLQQHHQFEMLLRKGIDKDDKLKTAILDYLKRFHSDDKDTYSMVALNFSMYREIAHMLDESGHRHLDLLRDNLENNRETQDSLKKCNQYFCDAAESYAKDKCFMNAQKCLRWARLVNLQLHLLGSGVKVINLTPEEIKTFVATHPKFLEVYVVTEAYGGTVDWSEGLYTHVLMSGDMRYLQDFRTYVKLTSPLIETTVYKLRNSPGKLTSCANHVKKLLKLCPDVWLHYQMAQTLGLQDVIRELLANDTSSSYIKDMINSQA